VVAIDNALAEVSRERANLGAFQNRLEHAVSNMMNMSANTADARSVIADADYAQESSSLAKNQILQQAGTAMLAQANAQSQTVLSLLK
jgi:flagellin